MLYFAYTQYHYHTITSWTMYMFAKIVKTKRIETSIRKMNNKEIIYTRCKRQIKQHPPRQNTPWQYTNLRNAVTNLLYARIDRISAGRALYNFGTQTAGFNCEICKLHAPTNNSALWRVSCECTSLTALNKTA
jgi:hypothetical protein